MMQEAFPGRLPVKLREHYGFSDPFQVGILMRPPKNPCSGYSCDCTVFTVSHDFEPLLTFLERLPAINLPAGRKSIGAGSYDSGNWWVKFSLNTDHPLAWRHVQELGHVLNLLSIEERLPTVFKPVSPPPYMNGGVQFLSWVIESTSSEFTPALCAQWLEGRLPRPVSDLEPWKMDDDE